MLKQENGTMAEFEEYLPPYLPNDSMSQLYRLDTNDLATLEVDELERLGTFNSQGNLVVLSPPETSDDTLDIALAVNHVEFFPLSPRGPPARTPFAGDLNFSVEIDAADTHRKKYLYSHQLNRIYVDRKTSFPVQFRWDFARAAAPMFVRATTVFSDDSQAEKRVERCLQHIHESCNAGVDRAMVHNVLHSSREAGTGAGTAGVHYCGAAAADAWYSVLVRFDGRPAPAPSHAHAYQFVCKNSCSSGINRRAIDIIFTLEDQNGQVYGRQTVGARVCACPRRDKHKDEEAAPRAGKRRAPAPAPAPARAPPTPASTPQPDKRVKLEPDDDVFPLPQIQIVGRKTLVTGLEVMLNMMEAVAAKSELEAREKYHSSIRSLREKINELKNPQE